LPLARGTGDTIDSKERWPVEVFVWNRTYTARRSHYPGAMMDGRQLAGTQDHGSEELLSRREQVKGDIHYDRRDKLRA
jgi:hypothetical protein